MPMAEYQPRLVSDGRDDSAKVEAWRLLVLIEAGFRQIDAERIAARFDVDLHVAVELLESGCPSVTAAEILL